jgi:hypothetical protein
MGEGLLLGRLLVAVFAALVLVIAYRLLTGQIDRRGLLTTAREQAAEPDRAQMLVLTMIGAGAYAMLGVRHLAMVAQIPALPDPPSWLVIGLGASHALYLAGKIARRARG